MLYILQMKQTLIYVTSNNREIFVDCGYVVVTFSAYKRFLNQSDIAYLVLKIRALACPHQHMFYSCDTDETFYHSVVSCQKSIWFAFVCFYESIFKYSIHLFFKYMHQRIISKELNIYSKGRSSRGGIESVCFNVL